MLQQKILSVNSFVLMALRGRIHLSKDDTTHPDTSRARSPVGLGRLYGYSEDDIAHFYLRRRGGHVESAYEEYVLDLDCP